MTADGRQADGRPTYGRRPVGRPDVWPAEGRRRRAGDAADLTVPAGVLDRLWPLHLVLDARGVIRHGGRTVEKAVGRSLRGVPLGDAFEVRPAWAGPAGDADVAAADYGRLHLRARTRHRTAFRAVVATLGPGRGAILDLSFGIGVAEAVSLNGLDAGDFPVTAQTVELFYLAEATDLAMAELRRANARLEAARLEAETHARTDPLTGVGNRRALTGAIDRLVLAGDPFAVIAFDLDRFKPVNDAHGHGAGDRVLRHVAAALAGGTRPEDTVARLGGDEFVVLVADGIGIGTAVQVAERLLAAIARPIPYQSGQITVSSSAGIALRAAGKDGPGRDAILAAADRALYAAKADGAGGVRVAGDV